MTPLELSVGWHVNFKNRFGSSQPKSGDEKKHFYSASALPRRKAGGENLVNMRPQAREKLWLLMKIEFFSGIFMGSAFSGLPRGEKLHPFRIESPETGPIMSPTHAAQTEAGSPPGKENRRPHPLFLQSNDQRKLP
jgi:hypothetical protein